MVSGLTRSERQLALIVLLGLFLCGLAFAAPGESDPISIHGLIVAGVSVALTFAVIRGYFEPEPPQDRLTEYFDDPTRAGIVLAMAWAVVGMFVGVWVAALLAWPDLTFDA